MNILDRILKNIKQALQEPKSEAQDSYIRLQVLLGEREQQKNKDKYGAANRRADYLVIILLIMLNFYLISFI